MILSHAVFSKLPSVNGAMRWLTCADGQAAWDVLQAPDCPQLVILDWMMPRLDGLQVCRNVRNPDDASLLEPYVYIILLTAKSQKTDMVTGLEAGADDYLTKPFDAPGAAHAPASWSAYPRAYWTSWCGRARSSVRQARKDSLTQLCTRATVLELLKA